MVNVPCKGCEKRVVGCHSNCEAYKSFVSENEKLKRFAKEQAPPSLNKWSWNGCTDTTGKRRRHDRKIF